MRANSLGTLDRVLLVEKVVAYGRESYYPADERSLAFCELLGQKILTTKDIENIKKIGFEIKTKEIVL